MGAERVHSGLRVHDRIESPNFAFWPPTRDMIPEKGKIYQCAFRIGFPIGSIHCWID